VTLEENSDTKEWHKRRKKHDFNILLALI